MIYTHRTPSRGHSLGYSHDRHSCVYFQLARIKYGNKENA